MVLIQYACFRLYKLISVNKVLIGTHIIGTQLCISEPNQCMNIHLMNTFEKLKVSKKSSLLTIEFCQFYQHVENMTFSKESIEKSSPIMKEMIDGQKDGVKDSRSY